MQLRSLAMAAILLPAPTFAAGVYEPFNYLYTDPPPGTSLDAQVNPSTGGEWFRMGQLTDDEILISNNNLSIDGLAAPLGSSIAYQGFGKTERLGIGTPGLATGTAYYSLAFQLTGLTGLFTLPNGVFVAGFNNVNPTTGQNGQPTAIGARLYIKPGVTPDTFLIGVAKNSSTAADFVFDTVERQLNTPIFIVGSYTINPGATNNDEARLWINPDKSTFAGAAPAPTLTQSIGNDLPAVASFLFRQGIGGVPDVNADELRVDASWAGVTGVGWATNLGVWSNSANWTGGTVPDAIGAEINFTPTPFASPLPINVQVDGNQKTVGTINFSSPEQVTIDCCGVLVLQNAAGTSSLHRASINVFAGSHLINTTLRLESNTTVNVVPPDSTLTMGANRGAEAHRLTKTGAGKLKLSALDVSDLIISAGSVEFQPLTSQKRAATLTIADGTTLDMTDNDLELTAGSQAALDAIEDLIVRGRSGGSWGGTGITSSAARDNPLRTTTLAAIINDNGQGQPISLLFEPGSVAIKYTWYGDTDLDDDVDADDYAQIDQGFAQGLSGWRFGDFDYSGSVNADDFFLIDRAFADQDVTLPGFAPASVPEPSALITLTSTLLLAAAGRYRGWREIIELP